MNETTAAVILVALYLLGVSARIAWPFALAYLRAGWFGAFAAVFGAGSIGRNAYKTVKPE